MTASELVEAAEFLVAFGSELADNDEYAATVQSILDRSEDKIRALLVVIGRLNRERARSLDRSSKSYSEAQRHRIQLEYLRTWLGRLVESASNLGETGSLPSDESVWYEAHLASMPTRPLEMDESAERRWALQVLSSTARLPPDERNARILAAIESSEDPFASARMIVLAAADRAGDCARDAADIEAAKANSEDTANAVKGWIERTLKRRKVSKVTDALGGWSRTITRKVHSAVDASWDGTGRPPDPSVDELPDRFVNRSPQIRKADLVKALKSGEGVAGARLHERQTTYVRTSK